MLRNKHTLAPPALQVRK